jgi:uncharacterized protein YkwD
VHHTPSRPPPATRRLATRLLAALTRALRLTGRGSQPRRSRWALAAACGFVATVAILVPVVLPSVSADGEPSVSLDASAAGSTDDPGTPLVQLGVDGNGSSAAPAADDPGTPDPSTVPGGTAGGAGDAPLDLPGADDAGAPTTSAEQSADASTDVPAGTSTGTSPSATPGSASSRAPTGTGTGTAPVSTAPTSAPAAVAAASGDPSAESQVLALVNQQREAAGCGDLTADAGLTALARAHSADMRDRGFFDHTNPDGLSPFDRAARAGVTLLAENIAYGQADAAAVMTDWMNSPGHRTNILNCSYSRIGVGVADGSGGPWWTQDFA